MKTSAAAGELQPLVLARIGGLHLAVPAAWVAGAHASRERLATLPRRAGAVAGLLPTANGSIPVVDLARWVSLPAPGAASDRARTDAAPCYLTLQQDGQRLAIQVDELLGLHRVPAERLQRVHHREDPEELFDIVLPGDTAEAPTVCLLEPQRLMRLLALWCDGAEMAGTAASEPAGDAVRTEPAVRLALIRTAGRRLAVNLRHVAELMPLPPLKTRLPAGGASAGFADWRGGTLAVLQAGWLTDQLTPPLAPLALVLRDDTGRAVALPVDELLGMTSAPQHVVPPDADAAPWRGEAWTDDDGPVEQLRVPALLDALPESALARRAAPAAGLSRMSNDRPYFVLQAGRTAALPIDEVLAVIDTANLVDDQQTLAWRGQQLPLRGRVTPGGVVVVLQGTAGATALRAQRLLGLVPAGAAEISALPGQPGGRMLHLPAQAASFVVAGAADFMTA